MKEFDITPVLTHKATMAEIYTEASERAYQQVNDTKKGNRNASYSYGKQNTIDTRSINKRLEDSQIGCLAEYLGSILTKCTWKKQRRQYNDGNREPDLKPIYKGKETDTEVRGTRSNTIVFRCYGKGRGKDFDRDSDMLLLGVTNLPNGPISRVGYLQFGALKELCRLHPEWYVSDNRGNPYYKVPNNYFHFDGNDFTPNRG